MNIKKKNNEEEDSRGSEVSSEYEVLDGLFEKEIQNKELVKTAKPKNGNLVRIASIISLISFSIIAILYLVFVIFLMDEWQHIHSYIEQHLDPNFLIYILGGFIAQMIDGSLGMAYGVSVTTFLLSLGLPVITPAVASASMHASEVVTTGASSLVYMRYKTVNKKLFKKIVTPGIIGAMSGAACVSLLGKEYIYFIKPIVALYTLSLGVLIILRALNIATLAKAKFKNIFPIALFGGFLDSLGGGGWGPIVTTSLVASGRNFRNSIGSSHLAKFFVALLSSITFFFFIGLDHWQIILGLIIGGVVAAPISIYLSNKIPIKAGLILVGLLVIIVSIKIIVQVLLPI